ncbi:MAG: hypothetical protein RL555_1511 [Bacteroidota bacterium]|jgi:hypothetical protein|nr:DUF1573 domain-containing protein [Bacteroidota bacterium]GDX41932.1 hypothetical protein LBMAG22_04610 [Bacteroidota bacterium]
MKKVLFAATLSLFSLVVFGQTKVDAVVKMNTEKHDFGKIKQGEPVTYSFEIKNISDKPLVVENSWASCGCTTPERIAEPIQPGASAKLKVQYNAAAVAPFTKDVNIKFAGIDEVKTVKITGEVLSTEAFAELQKQAPKAPVKKS